MPMLIVNVICRGHLVSIRTLHGYVHLPVSHTFSINFRSWFNISFLDAICIEIHIGLMDKRLLYQASSYLPRMILCDPLQVAGIFICSEAPNDKFFSFEKYKLRVSMALFFLKGMLKVVGRFSSCFRLWSTQGKWGTNCRHEGIM